MQIQAQTRLFDLLEQYPQLEAKIMSLAEPFRNLKNPILRKTVGKLATLEKVARIGNLDVKEFVNMLRSEVGQSPLESLEGATELPADLWEQGDPEWLKQEPAKTINGTEMLSRGEHPLSLVNNTMQQLSSGRFILLITNFPPLPLIDEMRKQRYEVISKKAANGEDQHYTYIRKP